MCKVATIGIRNLGATILNQVEGGDVTVTYLNTIDVLKSNTKNNNNNNTCSAVFKKGKRKGEVCGKPSKYKNNGELFCGIHKGKNAKKCRKQKKINCNQVVQIF